MNASPNTPRSEFPVPTSQSLPVPTSDPPTSDFRVPRSNAPLRVLLVEDSARDAELMIREIERGGIDVTWQRVETEADMKAALDAEPWDIVISDYSMPHFDGLAALRILRETVQDIPFILVSGTIGEDVAVEAMRAGAHDYLMKDKLTRLVPAIERELREADIRREHQRSEESRRETETRYRRLFESAKDGILILDAETGIVVDVNPFLVNLLGFSHAQFLGKTIWELGFLKDIMANKDMFQELQQKKYVRYEDLPLETADGRRIEVEVVSNVYVAGNEKVIQCNIRDITEHKQAAAKLQASEDKFKALYNNAPLSYQSLDEEGCFLDVNPTWLKTLGYERDEVIGTWYADLLHPDWKPHFETNFPAFKKRGYVHGVQYRIRHKDGHYLDIEFEGCIGYWPDGNFRQTYCVFQDITERIRAEEALHRASEIINSSPAVAFLWEKAEGWPVRYVSQNVEQMFGFTAEEFVSGAVSYTGLVHPDDLARVAREVASSGADLTTHTVTHTPYRIVTKSGDVKWVEDLTTILRKENGLVDAYRGILLDITDRKQAEKEIARSAALLNTVLDLLPAFICVKNLEGRFLLVNRRLEDFYGVPPTAMAGTLHAELCKDKEELRAMLAADREVFESGSPKWIPEETMKKPDGSVAVLETHKVPFTAHDEPAVLVISSDITERKRAEAAHEKLQAQFTQAQKMESVGRLAGGVAHDFNNMLMGIMNYAELCRDKIGPDHPIREWLNEITVDAERSTKLTHQLLAFARKQIIAPKVIDLNDAISSMLKLLRRLIGEDIAINLRPGPNVWPVKMDPVQIDQILANLAVNARDAIGGVGSIAIETSNVTFDAAYCADHAGSLPGDYTLLTVTDSGCGMDEETLKNIFEPFFTTKGEGEGTGLGLATVYGIVKQNDGFINVYSEPGKGTTFRIYLPRVAASEAAQMSVGKPKPPPRGNETVLLVEDEKSVRVTTHLFLEDLGYTTLAAEAPDQALQLAAQHTGQIDLLITDVIMPGMSGHDLAKRLSELRPSIQCLFISGFTADVIAQRGILDDGVNFLSKPFGRDALARKVREVLESLG